MQAMCHPSKNPSDLIGWKTTWLLWVAHRPMKPWKTKRLKFQCSKPEGTSKPWFWKGLGKATRLNRPDGSPNFVKLEGSCPRDQLRWRERMIFGSFFVEPPRLEYNMIFWEPSGLGQSADPYPFLECKTAKPNTPDKYKIYSIEWPICDSKILNFYFIISKKSNI